MKFTANAQPNSKIWNMNFVEETLSYILITTIIQSCHYTDAIQCHQNRTVTPRSATVQLKWPLLQTFSKPPYTTAKKNHYQKKQLLRIKSHLSNKQNQKCGKPTDQWPHPPQRRFLPLPRIGSYHRHKIYWFFFFSNPNWIEWYTQRGWTSTWPHWNHPLVYIFHDFIVQMRKEWLQVPPIPPGLHRLFEDGFIQQRRINCKIFLPQFNLLLFSFLFLFIFFFFYISFKSIRFSIASFSGRFIHWLVYGSLN